MEILDLLAEAIDNRTDRIHRAAQDHQHNARRAQRVKQGLYHEQQRPADGDIEHHFHDLKFFEVDQREDNPQQRAAPGDAKHHPARHVAFGAQRNEHAGVIVPAISK